MWMRPRFLVAGPYGFHTRCTAFYRNNQVVCIALFSMCQVNHFIWRAISVTRFHQCSGTRKRNARHRIFTSSRFKQPPPAAASISEADNQTFLGVTQHAAKSEMHGLEWILNRLLLWNPYTRTRVLYLGTKWDAFPTCKTRWDTTNRRYSATVQNTC